MLRPEESRRVRRRPIAADAGEDREGKEGKTPWTKITLNRVR
jgi:hypothetical protein